MSISAGESKHTGNISPEFALLGFLVAGPSHGYDLHHRCVVELGHVWHVSQSQAYAILKRLEQHGDITAQIVEQDKLPARQMLNITAQGRLRFDKWMGDIGATSRSIRLEFLTRLYFARMYNPEKMGQIFEAQCNGVKLTIERLETLLTNLPPEQQFNQLSLDLRLRQMQLIQEWMRDIKTKIIDSKE
jgi:PadR family transcriptional regulator, regulatory protein AphA